MSIESGGLSDIELISAMVSKFGSETCANPSKMSVRRVDTKELIPKTGGRQIFKSYDTVKGFQCLKETQPDGSLCLDYEVQWCCPGKFTIFPTNNFYTSRDRLAQMVKLSLCKN